MRGFYTGSTHPGRPLLVCGATSRSCRLLVLASTRCNEITSDIGLAENSSSEKAKAVAGYIGVQRSGINYTRNSPYDGNCMLLTMILARGTREDTRPDTSLAGPVLVYSLNTTFGLRKVAVQGVNYCFADEVGFCEGGSHLGRGN